MCAYFGPTYEPNVPFLYSMHQIDLYQMRKKKRHTDAIGKVDSKNNNDDNVTKLNRLSEVN